MAAAGGAVVELLNDDTEVTPGWAAAALAQFRDPNVVAVAPLVLRLPIGPRGPRIDSAGDAYHPGGFARKRGHGRLLASFPLRPGPVFGASASSAFFRRDVFLNVGGFPESFGSYFEDVDLAFRLRRAGGAVVFEPASVVGHRLGASHDRAPRRLVERQSCNEERVYWRNVAPSLLPLHLAVLAAKAVRRWEEGRLLPFLFGRLRAFAALPIDLRHRGR
jgi:GT2 family glycosyltransferase